MNFLFKSLIENPIFAVLSTQSGCVAAILAYCKIISALLGILSGILGVSIGIFHLIIIYRKWKTGGSINAKNNNM
jgi:hypothetical protein